MSRTTTRVISGAVLGLTIVAFSFWWVFIRAPGPIAVCDHILEVTLAESRDQSLSEETQARLVESTRDQCIQHKHDKLLLRGRIKYAAYAKCVMDADDLVAIGRC